MSSREEPNTYISIKPLSCPLKTSFSTHGIYAAWVQPSAAHLEADDKCLETLRAAEPRRKLSQLLPEGKVLRGRWPGHNSGGELASSCLSIRDLCLQLQDPRPFIGPSWKPLELASHLLMWRD